MSDLIQWPTAKYWTAQWNPIIGCKPCSPACENCYAKAWADRFRGGEFTPRATNQRPPRKGVVFCGNMTDLFGEWVPPNQAADNILATQWCADDGLVIGPYDATYIWLTKRVTRMCSAIDNCGLDCGGLETHYFGFTAENQYWWDMRIGEADFPEGIKWWVSCEPLLGPIDLWLHAKTVLADGRIAKNNKPSWLVVGCESGPNRRPCKLEWVESIVEQCRTAKLPVFVKQLDIGGKCVTDITKFPEHLRIRQVPWAEKKGERK